MSHSRPAARKLKIGFVHRFDARDMRSWSGIFYFMAQALEVHVGEIVYLGPDNTLLTRLLINITFFVNRICYRLTKKHLVTDNNQLLSYRLGRFFGSRLQHLQCDVLFAPVASVEIANLHTNLPIVYCTDIPWNAIVGYYPEFSTLSRFGKAQGELMEAQAIRRASASVFPSQWALDSAATHYGADIERAFKVSFGANFLEPPSRHTALNRHLGCQVKLLMVAVDWERKGGPVAFECLTNLLDRGIDAQLTLVGCVPPRRFEHDRLHVIPFLNKHDPEQRKRLYQLFLQSHFLLLPTRAEGLGVVTCEASAFGLPTLATDTGGVRGALNDGVNGFLLPPEAPGSAYAGKIAGLISTPDLYQELVISSRNEFERSLNWDAWGRAMRPVIEGVVLDHAGVAISPPQSLPVAAMTSG